MSDDGLNSMKAMHFCKLILDENETIGYMPQITLLNIKVKFSFNQKKSFCCLTVGAQSNC